MRELMVIPIIHAASDLGNLEEPIDRVKIGLAGERSGISACDSVNGFWNSLKLAIKNWKYDFANLTIYQDALPVGPNTSDPIERKIVKELADKGSVNHQLIELLIEQGAELVGTEDPNLLLKEYDLVKRFLNLRLGGDSQSDEEEEQITRQQNEILVKRDQFIANRIGETLVAPQVGLIFLGMLHRLEEHLPSDFQVSYPFGRPSNLPLDSFSA